VQIVPEMTGHELRPAGFFSALGDRSRSVTDVLNQYGLADPAPEGNDREKLYQLLLNSEVYERLRTALKEVKTIDALRSELGCSR